MYSVEFSKIAVKDYRKIPSRFVTAIDKAIEPLCKNARPVGSKKLFNSPYYRIRVGDYRILYEIHADKLIILLLRIRHRKEVYKKMKLLD
jgi:mRNA interferase RelE/StbE